MKCYATIFTKLHVHWLLLENVNIASYSLLADSPYVQIMHCTVLSYYYYFCAQGISDTEGEEKIG